MFTALAELTTRQVAERMNATGMPQNTTASRTGGGVARRARQDFETLTGQAVVSPENALPAARKSLKAAKATPGTDPEEDVTP